MAVRPLSTIKEWFETKDIPTQTQFWDTWDSFWHKQEGIPTTTITGLDAVIGDLYAQIASVVGSGLPALPSGQIFVGNGSGLATAVAMSGDATIVSSGAITLGTVNSNVFGSNNLLKFAVNAKGLVTSAVAVSSSDIISSLGFTPYNATNPSNFIDLADLSATTPLSYDSGTGAFTIQQASGSQAGFLSSADWSTFNGKYAGLPTQTGNNGKYLTTNGTVESWATIPNPTLADPTGTVGLSVVNGVASTYMRSDAAPALSQSIAPTWTAQHIFSLAPRFSTITTGSVLFAGASGVVSQDNTNLFWDATNFRLGIRTTPSYTLDMGSSTGAVRLPVGTTAQQPSAAAGIIRFNSTINRFEGYDGSVWNALGIWKAATGTNIYYSGENVAIGTNMTEGRLTVGNSLNAAETLVVRAQTTPELAVRTGLAYWAFGANGANVRLYRTSPTGVSLLDFNASTSVFKSSELGSITNSVNNVGFFLHSNTVYAPSIFGIGSFTGLGLNFTINQTAANANPVTGIDYNPTLTSVLGPHYGLLIRPTVNNGFGTATPTQHVDINGNLRIRGTGGIYDYNNSNGSDKQMLCRGANGVEWATTTLFTQTASATVNNTTSATTLTGTGVGTLTVPANTFVAGKTYRITARGFWSTNAVNTLTLFAKVGSTSIGSTDGITLSNTSTAPAGWTMDIDLTIRTTGASGTAIAQGMVWIDGQRVHMLNITTFVINTTTTNLVDVLAQWNAAASTDTITCTNLSIVVKN